MVDRENPECAWVFAGEGHATQKLDGIACLVRDGVLWRRCYLRRRQSAPAGFMREDIDTGTGRVFGWVPVGDGADDAKYRSAFERLADAAENFGPLADGRFELLGPKVNGNPERLAGHVLVRHMAAPRFHPEPPRSFGGLRAWLDGMDIEGLVFHHPDGRMAKITLRDFGLKRARSSLLSLLFGQPPPKTLISGDLDA